MQSLPNNSQKKIVLICQIHSQAENLAEFYDFCKQLELARTFQFPTLRQVSYFVSTSCHLDLELLGGFKLKS
jgi:hypothetical protein